MKFPTKSSCCNCNSLNDEEPDVLDVDPDEGAGGRGVHERPEGGEEGLLDAVLVVNSIEFQQTT